MCGFETGVQVWIHGRDVEIYSSQFQRGSQFYIVRCIGVDSSNQWIVLGRGATQPQVSNLADA